MENPKLVDGYKATKLLDGPGAYEALKLSNIVIDHEYHVYITAMVS